MTRNLDTVARGDRRRTRAYLREFAVAIGAYVVVLAVSIPLAGAAGGSPWRWFWAVLPVLPVAGVAVAVVRHLRRIDGFQRLQLLEGLAVGFVVAMLAAVTLGLIAPFGAVLPAAPWLIYAAGMLAWLVAGVVQRAR